MLEIVERELASVRVQGARASSASPHGNAVELVAQTVDPKTGRVDTFRIALWVTDASKRDLEKAALAYAAIEAHLLARGPGEVARFNQDLVELLGEPATRGRKRLLVDNPVLARDWEPPAHGPGYRGRFVSGLQSLLDNHGIDLATSTGARALRPQVL